MELDSNIASTQVSLRKLTSLSFCRFQSTPIAQVKSLLVLLVIEKQQLAVLFGVVSDAAPSRQNWELRLTLQNDRRRDC